MVGNVEKYGLIYNDLRSNIFGTALNKGLFEFMTKKSDDYSFAYRDKYNIHYHVKAGYFAGKACALKDSLFNNDINNHTF